MHFKFKFIEARMTRMNPRGVGLRRGLMVSMRTWACGKPDTLPQSRAVRGAGRRVSYQVGEGRRDGVGLGGHGRVEVGDAGE